MLSFLRNKVANFRKKKIQSYLGGLVDRGLQLGEQTSIQEPFFLDPAHAFLIDIGERCTFAPGVRLIAHDASIKRALGFTKIGRIRIGNDTFLGSGVTVLCNVSIGHNCIVGAGAVVTRSIPDGSIAVGNPAKVIGDTETYLEECRQNAKELGVFDRSYQIDRITKGKVEEIREATAKGIRYLV